jgi:hypothetical protein
MERLADVGIEEEEEDVGNHVWKKLVLYCVNYKEYVLLPVNKITCWCSFDVNPTPSPL